MQRVEAVSADSGGLDLDLDPAEAIKLSTQRVEAV